MALVLGQRDEAQAGYDALRPLLRDPDFLGQAPGVGVNLVPLLEEFRDLETAEWLAERFDGEPPFASGGAGTFCVDCSSSWSARLAALLDRHDEAVRLFEKSIAWDTRPRALPYVVHNRVRLASVLLTRGDGRAGWCCPNARWRVTSAVCWPSSGWRTGRRSRPGCTATGGRRPSTVDFRATDVHRGPNPGSRM